MTSPIKLILFFLASAGFLANARPSSDSDRSVDPKSNKENKYEDQVVQAALEAMSNGRFQRMYGGYTHQAFEK
ncbi:MAG: hypothetical protein KDD35_01600 [Bdellovibrionales bacterium]|nr:hypothetical protein [Bdellovibrionales bacterium]